MDSEPQNSCDSECACEENEMAMESSEDDNSFTLELSASEMYSLRSILAWASIEIDDPTIAFNAESISQEVAEVTIGEQFFDKIEKEQEEATEAMEEEFGNRMGSDIPGMGVQ